MKLISFFIGLMLLYFQSVYAEAPPLKVAVDNFSPPFVMRGANNLMYGFDISMMNHICHIIKRTCQYTPMIFSQLIEAVETKQADVAAGAITITAERSSRVNFSKPYLVSKSYFISLTKKAPPIFKLELLNNKKIGVEKGSIFPQVLSSIGVKNPEIVVYDTTETLIEGLQAEDIDFILMDAPEAMFWQSTSSETIALLGKPFVYGFGLGIAVNRENLPLLVEINKALVIYQNSKHYTREYKKYLGYF